MKSTLLRVFLAIVLFCGLTAMSMAAPSHKQHTKTKKEVTSKKPVKCPVTGGSIDPAKAYAKTVYKGKIYYFCCAGCPEEFKKNPGKYAK